MSTSEIKRIINAEAKDCRETAKVERNTPEDRNIFFVVAVILESLANRFEDTHPSATAPVPSGADKEV